MAALTETGAPGLLELRHLRAVHLDRLLDEETGEWKESLAWDFHASAELVRRFLNMRALSGFALTLDDEVIGYSYYVSEETKGLIGDLYVRQEYRCREYEDQLLRAVVGAMARTSQLRRVESQLMLLPSSLDRPLPFPNHLSRYRRDFMEIDSKAVRQLAPGSLAASIRIEPWTQKMQEPAAQLIADAYSGHIDSEINDQYRSAPGARRFLLNIVQYPGCGTFFPPGSCLAIEDESGRLTGLSLASVVAHDVGHITQICILPQARRMGIGYEILRASLQGLVGHGCRKVSLTVTGSNADAHRLYDQMGFRLRRSFGAYVWEDL